MLYNGKKIETKAGEAVVFGKLKIPKSRGFDYEIPLLSFVVLKSPDGEFAATCIHLLVDGYGDTPSRAMDSMVDNVWHFLWELFNNAKFDDTANKDLAWDNFLRLSNNNLSRELWKIYHTCQVALAKNGIATDITAHYERLINKIKELENEMTCLKSSNRFLKERLDAEIRSRMIVEVCELKDVS